MAVTPAKVSEWLNKLPRGLGEPSSYCTYDAPLKPLYLLQEEGRGLEAWPSPAPLRKASSVGAGEAFVQMQAGLCGQASSGKLSTPVISAFWLVLSLCLVQLLRQDQAHNQG